MGRRLAFRSWPLISRNCSMHTRLGDESVVEGGGWTRSAVFNALDNGLCGVMRE